MDWLNLFLHVDQYLGRMIEQDGLWIYAILFAIVFAETGLVIFPFLPGDSLLFIAGAFCASGSLSFAWLTGLLLVAAIAGNTLNFWIGAMLGNKIWDIRSRWIDQQALLRTHQFFVGHGGKTIVLARFIPIVRTFAPFVAGISQMNSLRFQLFNVGGAILWVVGLVSAGYFFGNLPFVKQYLNVIILVGIGAAVIPAALGGAWRILRGRFRQQKREKQKI
ncbi:MAG: VTT domain-containing protein [Ottowia sp.]|nr:VTT domain-containing protein [Ottowia sp.]